MLLFAQSQLQKCVFKQLDFAWEIANFTYFFSVVFQGSDFQLWDIFLALLEMLSCFPISLIKDSLIQECTLGLGNMAGM